MKGFFAAILGLFAVAAYVHLEASSPKLEPHKNILSFLKVGQKIDFKYEGTPFSVSIRPDEKADYVIEELGPNYIVIVDKDKLNKYIYPIEQIRGIFWEKPEQPKFRLSPTTQDVPLGNPREQYIPVPVLPGRRDNGRY